MDKKRRFESERVREIKQVVSALTLDVPTTTKEGMRNYRRIERRAYKIVKNGHAVSQWEKVKQALIEFWNTEF